MAPRSLMEKERPEVRLRRWNRRLDDTSTESLEIGDPCLGRIALLRLAPVSEIGRSSQQPHREAVEPCFGRSAPGQHRPEQRNVRDGPPHRPDGIERGAEGKDAVERKKAPLQT